MKNNEIAVLDSQLLRDARSIIVYPIASAVRSQLNWSQYRMLIQIADPDKQCV
ncbi:MAG: hypothetical protein IJM59_05260 [Proteobacteria bacterium]|nr:hypothetical protein [Pseudomonadota bacterium]